jgi:WD40 repeat protein
MGKAPMEFGGAGGAPATMVAANPKMDVIAAGFDNGAIIVGQPGNLGAMLVTAPTGSSVTAMAWNPDGDKLLAGTESGDIHLADFRI